MVGCLLLSRYPIRYSSPLNPCSSCVTPLTQGSHPGKCNSFWPAPCSCSLGGLLGGSWDLVSRVITKVTILITKGLLTLLTKSHDPPSRALKGCVNGVVALQCLQCTQSLEVGVRLCLGGRGAEVLPICIGVILLGFL